MGEETRAARKLGMNGLGRIVKLSIWHHVGRQYFSEILVNIGREVGTRLADIAHFLEKDSTYGALNNFLYGSRAGRVIEQIDEKSGSFVVNGINTTFLRNSRNPAHIDWRKYGVDLVVDATGAFLDPAALPEDPKGSVRGHFVSGAKKVIVSAPFKIKEKGREMPPDAVRTVMGINDSDYDPKKHLIVSNASCTATCLAYMVKPLLDYFGAGCILSTAMTTNHGFPGSQTVIEHTTEIGATHPRKSPPAFDFRTTRVAQVSGLIIPEAKKTGFSAKSVCASFTTSSLLMERGHNIALVIQEMESKCVGGTPLPAAGNRIHCNPQKHTISSHEIDTMPEKRIVDPEGAFQSRGEILHRRSPLVFLSYSENDADIVTAIAEGLKHNGIEIWFAQEQIGFGDNVTSNISKGLDSADVLVFLSLSIPLVANGH